MKTFKLQTWHFGLMLIALSIVTNIIGTWAVNSIPDKIEDSRFVELNDKTFDEAIRSGTGFVLFYKENSDLCDKMEYNLNQLPADDNEKINYYKVNIAQFYALEAKYRISGVPSVLIYKDGKEAERILGVIPESNLKIIYNRVIK
ncbi:thioredoxin family protein [Dysgonomonas termitidis]|uniref:Thioredoxin family protein n=1 Tax=Dysgonomonas termitidis TaxID=1516126 RepID=A0ABV9L3Q2_9BACT